MDSERDRVHSYQEHRDSNGRSAHKVKLQGINQPWAHGQDTKRFTHAKYIP